MVEPCYDFNEFRRICREKPKSIILWRGVEKRAYTELNLKKNQMFALIGREDGLEKLSFIEPPKPLKNNPKILIDRYEFYLNDLNGYLAILKDIYERWNLKSFHKNIKEVIGDCSKSPQMLKTLKELGISKKAFRVGGTNG